MKLILPHLYINVIIINNTAIILYKTFYIINSYFLNKKYVNNKLIINHANYYYY